MKRLLYVLVAIAGALTASADVMPHCGVRFYDEKDRLSQRSVKQIVVDDYGLVWIATWNGLNRFDGYDFSVIRPALGDSVRRYSSRYRDIKPGAGGRLCCRIDDRLVRLDPATNRFEDIHSALEQRLGRVLQIKSWKQSAGGDTLVLKLNDGHVIIPDVDPIGGVTFEVEPPKIKYSSPSNRKLGDFGPYGYIIYSPPPMAVRSI